MPVVSDDGKLVVASARSADNKDRWFVTLDPATGKTKVIDTLHDDAWIREIGGSAARGVEFLPDNKRVLVPVRARRLDAPLHARRQRRRRASRSS